MLRTYRINWNVKMIQLTTYLAESVIVADMRRLVVGKVD